MENSPTEQVATEVASTTEPTTAPVTTEAAEVSQETSSETSTTSEESVSTTSPVEQTKEVEADDGLAKFAQAQGFDPENLTDGERKALKIAHDNQKAYRSSTNKAKVAEVKASVDGDISRDEIEAFKNEFRQYQATRQAEAFFNEDGRDDTLAPVMSEILEEKKAQFGPDYARVLSQDLPLLYDLARIKAGTGSDVDAEAIRREERESINRNLASNTPTAHAVTNAGNTPAKVTLEWIRTEYNSKNPEHVALVNEFYGGQK